MRTIQRKRRRSLTILAAVSAAAALGLAGCSAGSGGSGDTGTGADPDQAAGVPQEVLDRIEQYSAAQPFEYDGPAFDASAAGGSTLWWVPMTSQNPFLVTVGGNLEKALATQSVSLKECDGNANPVDINNCVSQATAQGAAAIQVDGPEPDMYLNTLQAAAAAGIPVLVGAAGDASDPVPAEVAGISSQPFALSGQLAADWVISDSGAKANVLLITTPDVVGSISQQEGFEAEMAEFCPECKVTVEGVTLGNWATDLGQTVSAALSRDPSIDYVFPVFDPMTQFTNPAIQQAGRANSVKVVTVNGNLPFMQELADPDSLIHAMIGLDLNAQGWIEADLALRAMTGNPTVANAYPPARLFTKENVSELTLDAESSNNSSWYSGAGTVDDFFQELWKG
jgi:ribose transport system substrate-binding protein